jgi:hypothetical protein
MPDLPVSYLFDSNKRRLEEFLMARLNHVANMEKQVKELFKQIVEESVQAEFARWLMVHRDELYLRSVSLEVKQNVLDFAGK